MEIGELVTTLQGGLLTSIKKGNQYHMKKVFYLQQTHCITRNSKIKYAELVQRIYNGIFTRVYKVSLQGKNKPGRNST